MTAEIAVWLFIVFFLSSCSVFQRMSIAEDNLYNGVIELVPKHKCKRSPEGC
ncbi:MAG: hypothetical protein JSV75_05020 [Candidatus Bathyarchaeota archaeon]|nr:MAG: hypothetical protein JSV75_05020 [Candidatus Bathyarchaeota archaeon]